MLLAIDVGNSNIKTGLFRGKELIASWRITTRQDRSSDETGLQMVQFLQFIGFKPSDVEAVIVSSVSPGMNYTIERMINTYFQITPLFVSSSLNMELTIAYKPATSLGADRIANAVGAYTLYGGPVITVDFGTATTFGAISADGTFMGGPIAPGIRSATDALVNNAAQQHRFDFVTPKKAVANTTIEAMQAGVMYGFSGLADHIIERMKSEIGPEAKVIATGGMSDVIAGDSRYIDVVDKLLTLKGLQILYSQNS